MEVDHYAILGLPTGLQAARLSLKDIVKAYKFKALKLHPDKRRDDPNAHNNFQRLLNSYHILKDENSRRVFDDRLRAQHHREFQEFLREKKMAAEKKEREEEERRRRKMMAELRKRRELAEKKAKKKRREMRMRRELEEERRRLEMVEYLERKQAAEKEARDEIARFVKDCGIGVDRENVLKVSWDRIGQQYSIRRLRELFQQFGEVRYVLIRSCDINERSAFIVMSSKDAVVAATRNVVGYLDNPLLVLPVLKGSKKSLINLFS